MKTDTGHVVMSALEGTYGYTVETDTGDVSGSFLTPKRFQAHSNTGKVVVPSSTDGGDCRIETDTGSIHIQ